MILDKLTGLALSLRYRVRVDGLDEVASRGRGRILFLANHPALSDPVFVLTALHGTFRPRPVGIREQIDRPVIRSFARLARAIPMPDPQVAGSAARPGVEAAMDEAVATLKEGQNVLLWPSGHLYTSRFEDLRGNSGAHGLLARVPDARVVLVRVRGLWGSSFSRARGEVHPDILRALRHGLGKMLLSGIVGMPRRKVGITLIEPDDLPRGASREEFNGFLEDCFNTGAEGNTYVPYTPWERGGVRELDDPETGFSRAAADEVPPAVRETVTAELRRLAGADAVGDDDHLARDLGLDSLVRAELIDWLGREFGFASTDVDALVYVSDVLHAASGHSPSVVQGDLRPIPKRWFAGHGDERRLSLGEGETVAEAFLEQALRAPGRPILADQLSGVRTYGDLILRCAALQRPLAELPGRRLGVMLPASVAADVVFMAVQLAGRTPVMVNWTTGPRNVCHGLDLVGVEHVLTARALVERLSGQGVETAPYADRFVFLEELADSLTARDKIRAAWTARLRPHRLLPAATGEPAVVLFTSGSEALPKAVPLSHANLLTNLRDICSQVPFRGDDRLLSILPPFHSFGLTAGMLMPLLTGLPTVHHANPYEAAMLVRLVRAYQLTLLGGTPTFLAGMVRAAGRHDLESLRLAVTGGEACPEGLYRDLSRLCPNALVLEGYGVTECSPIVSINSPAAARAGTIGRPLPSVQHALVHPESGEPVARGERGVLLVRGPSVFDGYLGPDAASPFETVRGESWFRTGDIVSEDRDGFLHFHGRVSRFVKIGGEMVSLPAVEAVLAEGFDQAGAEGPVVAVMASSGPGRPELVLATTLDLDRERANRCIRDQGLSPLHFVRRVVRLPEIPVLGTGKTDYRSLREVLADPS